MVRSASQLPVNYIPRVNTQQFSRQHWPIWIAVIVFALWRAWAATFMPFFWDAPLGLLEPAQYLYTNGLQHLIFPQNLIAEPPLLPLLLAMLWKLVGVNMWSCHALMAAFTLGAVFQIGKLAQKFSSPQQLPWILLLVFSEATWVALSQHLSPDLALVFFGVLAINALHAGRFKTLTFAGVCLSMLSVRGEITLLGIGFGSLAWNLWAKRNLHETITLRWCLKLLAPYLPALSAAILFWIVRKFTLGHFYFDPGYISIQDRAVVPLQKMVRNVAVMAWRFTDMGRIAYWIVLCVTVGLYRKKMLVWLRQNAQAAFYLFGIFLALLPFTLPFSNPFCTRYFLMQFILGLILLGKLILDFLPRKSAIAAILFMVIASWSAHLVMLPIGVSRAWDGTLATLIYFDQVKEAQRFFKEHHIALEQVGFDHTEKTTGIDLFHDRRESDRYAIISHVQNPSDQTLDSMDHYWEPIADLTEFGLQTRIYRRIR